MERFSEEMNVIEKRRAYMINVFAEIEHASFTPLVFSVTGGSGPAATIFYKRLANLIQFANSVKECRTSR